MVTDENRGKALILVPDRNLILATTSAVGYLITPGICLYEFNQLYIKTDFYKEQTFGHYTVNNTIALHTMSISEMS